MSSKRKQQTRNVLRFLFVIYMGVLFYFMFFSERYGRTAGNNTYRWNLELFLEIKRFVKYRDIVGVESFIVNILGNILVFAPIGFLVPIVRKKKQVRETKNWFQRTGRAIGLLFHVTLVSLELSLFIEITQLITKVGCFDVDDLFMNTVGGLLGGIVYLICHRIIRRR
ncbi:MAG: VanZ family protein [bacterium]|nr:VanZ family protein [bacterium]